MNLPFLAPRVGTRPGGPPRRAEEPAGRGIETAAPPASGGVAGLAELPSSRVTEPGAERRGGEDRRRDADRRAEAPGAEEEERSRRDLRGIRHSLWVIAGIAAIGLLTLARPVVVPLLFALIISMALYPVVGRLARLGLPKPLGAALVVALMAGAGWASIDAAGEPLRTWAAKVPEIVQKVRTELGRVQRVVTQPAVRDVPLDKVRVRESDKPRIEVGQVVSLAGGMAASVRAALFGVAVTLALTYFMLATGKGVVSTSIALLPGHALRTNLRRLGHATQRALVRYLGAVTLINAALGLAVAALLAAIGLPGALFFGAIVAVMNFLPFVGAAISSVVLALAAFATFGLTAQALLVPLGFMVLHLLEAQFLTPFVIGRTLTLNPLFVILSVVVFGSWWGIGGAFLAVPLLVATKVAFDAVPRLRGWGQVLGRRRGFNDGIQWLEGQRRARARRRARATAPPLA
ncbi:MAG: AI-2E family transporter [Steroidobacteraceae bacterium]|jgi:predicted PurR-regulated permease PerM|nr:AI-2E family transporter [Steroidobacteraceae bacterium]